MTVVSATPGQPVHAAESTLAADDATTGSRSPRPVHVAWVGVTARCLLTAASVALYIVPLDRIDLNAMTGLGLISVLPASMLLGPAALIVAFVATLSLSGRRVWLLCVQLILLTLMLHGITALIESEPRFAISWVHAGFVEYIDRTGTTAPGLDARWSWPGFFGLAAFWVGTGDITALHPLLTGAPVVFNLTYLGALGLLLTGLRMSGQAKWLAALFFCLLNWVGQDYFSPQGWGVLLYLLFLALLVMCFRTPDGLPSIRRPLRVGQRVWHRMWRDTTPGELPQRASSPSERVVVYVVLVGLFVTATVCHQLTPCAMLLSAGALVLARRCVLTGLPVLLGVILVAWISYMTQAYWGGHFNAVLSGVGNVGGTVSANISSRASLGDSGHQWVVRVRMMSTVLVFLIAGLGALRRRRAGLQDRVLLALVAAPVGLALMQSYGGEMALRVYLFALAPACVLAALAYFPRPTAAPSLLARCAAGASALVMLFAFFVTRYGNEAFERIDTGAVTAVANVYEHTSGNVRFIYVTAIPELDSTPFIPLGYRDVERVTWKNTMAPLDPTDVTAVVSALREQGPGGYLISTRSQEAYIMFGQGYLRGWGDRFRQALAATPGIRVVAENPDAAVYTLTWPPGAVAARSAPLATGVKVWRTPWTPVGVVFLILLLAVLGFREARGIQLGSGNRRRLRPLTLAAVPLLIGFALVVIERFVLLTS
ncbi:hypothetical protein HH308_01250 [Gordonia sp. TBRC 11910]|uniref:Uncharacterized protein n=1 Tax=Gordonia asplenii TaxID=2725283 RepID=A0A848KUI1_9ACTN|nr:hypothetical protein [Gordonia asplenii]NMN99840.1 hypothetical protein [Gordonia asplenii]